MLNEKIITEAYITKMSGIGRWKNERELWGLGINGNEITIEFVDDETNHIIEREYYPFNPYGDSLNRDLKWENHYTNRQLQGAAIKYTINGEIGCKIFFEKGQITGHEEGNLK